MKNKKIVIAGGTGFIGQALAARWAKDNQIVILGRQAARTRNNAYGGPALTAAEGYHVTHWRWDGEHVEPHWADAIDGCDIVVNLAGRSVNCRYNRHNRQEILDSRLNSTKAIGEAVRAATVPPKLWVNMASATIYRHAEDRPQDEDTGEVGDDFSMRVCKSWEKTFFGHRTPFTRKIALRTAITLGLGGALAPYCRLVKWRLGGKQGSGRQMYSWVHIDDLGRAIEWFFDHPDMEGAYNIVAPGAVTNQHFMATLRRLMGYRFGLPAPAWLLQLGAALIGTETELVLKSRWVLPTKLERTGFAFSYPLLEGALNDLLKTHFYDTSTQPAAEKLSARIRKGYPISKQKMCSKCYVTMSKTEKKTVVLGASANPGRYSYLAVHRLRNAGHPVSAIGRNLATVADVDIITDKAAVANVHTVTLYLNAANQKEYYDYILSLHPRRIIFNPGAENPELETLASAHGIEPVEACTLVLLSTGQY